MGKKRKEFLEEVANTLGFVAAFGTVIVWYILLA